jgi:hypothetical protein
MFSIAVTVSKNILNQPAQAHAVIYACFVLAVWNAKANQFTQPTAPIASRRISQKESEPHVPVDPQNP